MKYLLATAVAAALLAPSHARAAQAQVLGVTPVYHSVPTEYLKCGIEPVAVSEMRPRIMPDRTFGAEFVTVIRHMQRCWTLYDVAEVTAGYNVRYSHEGREYTTLMTQQPGSSITVNADGMPLAG